MLIYDKAEILSLFSRIPILLENCCAFHSLLFPSRVWKFTNFPRIIHIKIPANILIYFINCLFDRILKRWGVITTLWDLLGSLLLKEEFFQEFFLFPFPISERNWSEGIERGRGFRVDFKYNSLRVGKWNNEWKKGGISNSSCLPSMNQQIPSFFQVDVSFSFNFEKK